MSRHNAESSSALPQHPSLPAIPTGPPPPPPPAPPSISCSKDRNYFYLKEVDSILFSATQTVCPFPSEVKPDFTHEDPDPENIFNLRFDLCHYIQVAATPDDSELKYTGPLFQRLATIQIVSSGSTHSLSGEQKASWKWLENTLHHAASTFSIDSLLPLDFSMLPLPSSYGYLRNHKKASHALRCAQRSRLAFHSLVGLYDTKPPAMLTLDPHPPPLTLSSNPVSVIHTRLQAEPLQPPPDSLHQWDALIEARKPKREEFLSRASDSIKERVKKRLQDAVNFIIPTRRDGTRFFMWYHSKQGRFRGELDYEDAKKEFETRRREQFVYDKISNQWDICSLFDKDRDVEHDDVAFDQPIQELDTTPTPQLNNPPTLSSDHNELGRTVVHQTPIGQDMLFGTSLEDVLYSHYGLLCSTQSEIQSATDFIHVEESQIVDAYAVRKYIMEVNLRLEHRSNKFAIRYFISSLILELEPPSLLWDLHPDHARELLTRNMHFKVEQVKDSTLPGYLLLPLVPKYARTWNLFVANATSIVQCIREEWGPSLEDVILCLFERSIPFKLLFKVTYASIHRPITVFESNRCPHGWTPDKYEYIDYELRRNRLLRLPHVRVAIAQAGGILWCLCKQELASKIPNGPSPDILYFADTSQDASHTYLFDTLTEHEIEILCGIYYVDTDRRDQTTTLAWWPSPQLWNSSGLDTGYWTLSCEQMFQGRLEKICARPAALLTTKKWRSDLKFYKKQTKKIHVRIEKECRQLLS
ncbi:hypothetical protein F4604DRAFT_1933307 [Suillus subluteus]|nr:hypothetical protein F4604DRAFT_1933307 [Suillus subluteus]